MTAGCLTGGIFVSCFRTRISLPSLFTRNEPVPWLVRLAGLRRTIGWRPVRVGMRYVTQGGKAEPRL